jgi:DNA polymerase elongation subunit (family B)
MIRKEELADVQKFLEGSSDKKYIVAIEGYSYYNYVECVIHDPEKGKYIEKMEYKPFIWLKDLPSNGINIYKDKEKRQEALDKYGLTIKKLKTGTQRRLEQGYKFIIHSTKSFNAIVSFFKDENIDIYSEQYRDLFFAVKPEEQFMIQNGIRLFKGYEKYNEVYKLTFDIETTGLLPENSRVFMIGIKDNKGFEHVCKIKKPNDDDEERKIIKQFFYVYNKLKPAIITTYNGENFDFEFIFKRCELLGLDYINDITTTLNPNKSIRRKENATVKYGNETGHYTQTIAWGYNIIDTIHAAKKTAAINKEIKNVKLKYLCQFEDIAKPNRMYINDGGNIFKYWINNKYFLINTSNNNYLQIPDDLQDIVKECINNGTNPLEHIDIKSIIDNSEEKYNSIITGSEIVDRYLLDDLWETEMLDNQYNESSFLLAKLIPTTFSRVCTMGTAAVWNLIMSEWSYINDIAIPIPDVGGKSKNEKYVAISEESGQEDGEEVEVDEFAVPAREESDSFDKISGGLARAYRIGYAESILKLDFASLYPSIQLTHGVFPNIDITNQLKKILLYLKITRDEYKYLSNDTSLDDISRQFYKTKQLPIKILNNSLFGALGSGVAFRWSDNDVAYRITTTGRVYLRQLIDWFYKRQFLPLLAVTDGVNFSIPSMVDIDINLNKLDKMIPINDIIYIDKNGKEHKGVNAYVEKYNTEVMNGDFMKIDHDGEWKSTLILSRINYANLTYESIDKKSGKVKPPKIKLTGNTIKSNTMPEYIEDYINVAMKHILENKPDLFIEHYYEYLAKIYYMQIPLKKIANKGRVKMSIKSYKNRGLNKNGKEKGKQAHMELLINANIPYEVGDLIYYVNTGTVKSHGDSKIIKDKVTKELRMASEMIDGKQLEQNPTMLGKYNIAKYIDNFNKRVEKILVGFSENVRNTLLKSDPTLREYYTDLDLKLYCHEKDNIEESMFLEQKEIEFWQKTGFNPYLITDVFKLPEGVDLMYNEYAKVINYINNKLQPMGKVAVDVNSDPIEDNFMVIKKGNDYEIHLYKEGYLRKVKQINTEPIFAD